MNKPNYDENICSKMTFSDLSRYLEMVLYEKGDIGIDLGYYSNFLKNEEAIQKRIEQIKGQPHYILQSKMDKIYTCDCCEY